MERHFTTVSGESRKMATKRVLIGLAALVATGVGVASLVHHRCKVDEQRALDEIVRYGIETRAFAFSLNHRGYVSPATITCRPSEFVAVTV